MQHRENRGRLSEPEAGVGGPGMSFLLALLLPVMATVILFRSYPARATRGEVSADLTTRSALVMGARTGAAALVFLGLLGVVILLYRGRAVTPAGIDVPAGVFWTIQFLIAAVLGAVVGALSALALLPWVRRRLAQSAPASPIE